MLCILENGALQKFAYLCIDLRVGDMTGQGSRENYSAFLCLRKFKLPYKNIWFLVFIYEGNSSFHVLIFDKTTTEIQYPLNNNCKLEDHQLEIIDLYEDDRNISLS